MIFSELYSAYYNTVAAIISRIIEGERSEKELQKIVAERAFGESLLAIIPSLKNEKWQLVHSDMTTPLEHKPTMPLTTLQKQWLKAISLDPRVKLFDVSFNGLDDVEPLFTPDDYYVYDKYCDGDDFSDEGYIERFRIILSAVRAGTPIKVNLTNRSGKEMYAKVMPLRLEYSEKDDKFRLITDGCKYLHTINLSKIRSVKYCGETFKHIPREERYDTVTLRIKDERNALERCMLHFAHFEKRAERVGKDEYLLHVKFDHKDESEIVIRTLSFGPRVKAEAPDSFVELIKKKLLAQKLLNLR
jgi:hypothetical protein